MKRLLQPLRSSQFIKKIIVNNYLRRHVIHSANRSQQVVVINENSCEYIWTSTVDAVGVNPLVINNPVYVLSFQLRFFVLSKRHYETEKWQSNYLRVANFSGVTLEATLTFDLVTRASSSKSYTWLSDSLPEFHHLTHFLITEIFP